jgi:hypothetical protein
MAIIEDRLSTTPVPDTYISPDGDYRPDWLYDFEQGPVALSDPSEGLLYQKWTMTYDNITGDLIATPETVGTPQTVITVPDVTQLSFSFDQNARISLTYTKNDIGHLYWYDSDEESFVTTVFDPHVICPVIYLDDHRRMEVDKSDLLLWYTWDNGDYTYDLYMAKQRERFIQRYLMMENVPPRIKKQGMHQGLRGQLTLTYAVQI